MPRPTSISISNSVLGLVEVAISCSLLTTSTSEVPLICLPVISPLPLNFKLIRTGSSLKDLKRSFLTFKIICTTSSKTPSIVENSCATPLILIAVAADPSKEDKSTRRREFPKVVPYPG